MGDALAPRENPTKEVVIDDDAERSSTQKRKGVASGRAKATRASKTTTPTSVDEVSDTDDAKDAEVKSDVEADNQGDEDQGANAVDTNATIHMATGDGDSLGIRQDRGQCRRGGFTALLPRIDRG
uniref:Uncharacterized protein n=1 Tax=Oryza punctata TaxID=4537 RepID=A0A0E0M5X8_ORYPU